MEKKGFKVVSRLFLFTLTCIASAGLLTSCGSSSSDSHDPFVRGASSAFVLTTDFSVGGSAAIDLLDLKVYKDVAREGSVHSIASAVYYNDKIFVINGKGMDSITVLDASDLRTVLNQFSVGTNTNPNDMAFVSDTKAYISQYGSNDLLVVDPTDMGNEIKRRIDLTVFTDTVNDGTDGIVEAFNLVLAGDRLFIGMQRLDRDASGYSWGMDSPGLIAVLDTNSDTFIDVDGDSNNGIQGIELLGKNPQHMDYDAGLGKILVSQTGGYGVIDGGLEMVDPVSYQADGSFIIAESIDNGDSFSGFAVINNKIFVTSATGYGNPFVMEFDYSVSTGATKTGNIFTAADNVWFVPLGVDEFERLIILDQNPLAPGVRFYDPLTDLLDEPLDVGLPPTVVVAF